MALTIDQLDIQISANAGQASTGLDRLAVAIENLGKRLTFNSKLSTFAKNIERISAAASSLETSRLNSLASSLTAIASVGKINLTSTINQLKKIPEVASQFNTVDMDTFTAKLKQMADALVPLNTQLNGVRSGLSKLPQEVNRVANASDKLERSTNRAATSSKRFSDTLVGKIAKWRILFGVFRSIANTLGDWFKKSNDYIETLNLFNVTMGDAAEQATAFAESVQEVMGVDIAEWMNYQGTFKQLGQVLGHGIGRILRHPKPAG